ncbi:MAG: 50S ribosomal protein L24 [Lentisphaeria bacterium]
MAKLHVKKGDEVVVISGGSKNKSGKVISVDTKKERVCVEGANIRSKAVRRSQNHPNGGIVKFEAPIHVSNVMLKSEYDKKRAN